ncbi:hypothetical protein [Bartonella sp. AC535YNZD]
METEEKLKIKSIRKCLSLIQKELADILGVKQAFFVVGNKAKDYL